MSGVFRDPATGEYRYYSYSPGGYDERQRREADDFWSGRNRPPPPPPPLKWTPPTLPAGVSRQEWWGGWWYPQEPAPQAPAPPPANQPAEVPVLASSEGIDWQPMEQVNNFVPPVATWAGPETPETATAVSFEDLNEFVKQLPGPPARVGDYPEFDAAFDRLTAEGRSITYQQHQDALFSPEAMEVWRLAMR